MNGVMTMTRQVSEEKITIRVAAKALGVTERTVQRYIEKGILSKIKDGYRIYVYADEVRKLRQQEYDKAYDTETSVTTGTTQIDASDDSHDRDTTVVVIDRPHYEGLLTRLGQLEAQNNHLIEYKEGLERQTKKVYELETSQIELKTNLVKKDKEIEAIKSQTEELEKEKTQLEEKMREKETRAAELETELQKIKSMSVWKRIFRWKKTETAS
jgi:DNA-binding transcriptional MerR regulator